MAHLKNAREACGSIHHSKTAKPLPPDLASVALIDAHTCCSVGGMSVSWWHDEVRNGRAPAPAVRMPRCTRWRLADVAAFWADFAESSKGGAQVAAQTASKAVKASAEARKPEAVAKAAATRKARIAARHAAPNQVEA